MGYYKDSRGIDSFRPDNGPTDLYIESSMSSVYLADLLLEIKSHFGEDSDINDFEITAEYIHTDCLGYDRYDAMDYTNYIHIHKIR